MLHGAHSFDDLRLKLIFFEQQSKSTQDRDVPTHQAFAATIGQSDLGGGGGVAPRSSNSNNKGRNNGGRNTGKRGRYTKNNNRNNKRRH